MTSVYQWSRQPRTSPSVHRTMWMFVAASACAMSSATPPCATTTSVYPLEEAPTPPAQPAIATSGVEFTLSDPLDPLSRRTYEWKTDPAVAFNPGSDAWGIDDPPPSFNSVAWSSLLNAYLPRNALDNPQIQLGLLQSQLEMVPGYPSGGRFKLNLLVAPSPGDFLPPSPTVGESSVCLLPAGAAQAETAWNGIGRPTLHESVDLITGVPLAKFTDLELPFGGATFRLNRTRSATSGRTTDTLWRDNSSRLAATDRWWDWAGQGWMASENPILLIDAAMAEVTGDGPRTTWLWLDAHHSIPFQQVYHPATGRMAYEAPPRFRARMEHNGVWQQPGTSPGGIPTEDDVVGKWQTRPTQFDIWLYDGLVQYTFVAVYDDMPPNRWDTRTLTTDQAPLGGEQWKWSSLHDRPITNTQLYDALYATSPQDARLDWTGPPEWKRSPGLGLPHYGLCVRVADQRKNEVRIQYSTVKRYSMDDPATMCIETIQDVQAKGQINYIELVSNGVVEWTLVYAHRRFAELNQPGPWRADLERHDSEVDPHILAQYPQLWPLVQQLNGDTMIDRIYVFEGGLPEADLAAAELTVGHSDVPGPDWGGVEPLLDHNANLPVGVAALPTDWLYQVRYHYMDPDYQISEPNPDPSGFDSLGIRPNNPPLLEKVTVRSREASAATGSPATPAAGESIETRAFAYGAAYAAALNDPLGGSVKRSKWLWAMFSPADVASFLSSSTTTSMADIRGLRHTDGISAAEQAILEHASLVYAPFQSDQATSDETPSVASLVYEDGGVGGRPYLRPDAGELWQTEGLSERVSKVMLGRRGEGRRVYRLSYYLAPQDPDPMAGVLPSWPDEAPLYGYRRPSRSIFAHPYAWSTNLQHASQHGPAMRPFADSPRLDKARWTTVVDEFPVEPRGGVTADSLGDYPEAALTYDSNTGLKDGQLSRRVVEMNPAGFVLRERTWEFSENGVASSGGGLGEQYIYSSVSDYVDDVADPDRPAAVDRGGPLWDDLLLVKHRSIGWSAAELAGTEDTEGLVSFFDHDLVVDNEVESGFRVEPLADGIRKGSTGTKYFSGKRFTIFDAVSNTETVVQLAFTEPVDQTEYDTIAAPSSVDVAYLTSQIGGGAHASVVITRRETVADPDYPDMPLRERPVISRMTIAPPRQQRPGTSASLYFPVDKEWYDDDGSVEWSATGLVRDPFSPNAVPDPLNTLIFTYYDRVDSGYGAGSARHTVVDAAPGGNYSAQDGSSVQIPSAPPEAGWMPTHTVEPAITSYLYNKHGLSDVYYSNGLRWARRIKVIPKTDIDPQDMAQSQLDSLPDRVAREYVFNAVADSAGSLVATEVSEIIDHADREPIRPVVRRRVEFTAPINLASPHPPAAHVRLAATRLGFDSTGRIRQAALLEWVPSFGWMEVGTKLVNDLGEVYRELELDGTVTRITRNSLGQDLRRYVGTADEGWVADQDSQGNTLPYNMALAERFEYGNGVHDAWLPTVQYEYRSNPTWARDHYGEVPQGDANGIATVTSYDWRMRPVRVDQYDQGDPATANRRSTTLTYLDHIGRTRLVARFGEGPLVVGSNDPAALGPADTLPPPSAFFGMGVRPSSVVEYLYDRDGTKIETRRYDVGWSGSGSPDYQADYEYRGFGGAVVFSLQPEVGTRVVTLDAQGRTKSVATTAPGIAAGGDPYGYELDRTEYVYDVAGNGIETQRWERVAPGGDVLSLGASNAVRSRTINWYDNRKQLLATAQLGTEQSTYTAGPQAWVHDGTNAPEITVAGTVDRKGLPASVPLTVYEYNNRGEQVRVAAPSGTGMAITVNEFSGLGRLVRKTENALDPDPAMRRVTEYEHLIGRLTTLRAFRTDTQSQVTKVEYGADVLDDSFAVVSAHNGLIGRMWMPDPITGAHNAGNTPAITLSYDFHGRVVQREDARGIVKRFAYDDAGRIVEVEVGYFDSGAFVPGYDPALTLGTGAPVDRVGFIEHEYDSDGMLEYVTARPLRNSIEIFESKFAYNDRQKLTHEWQSFGARVGPLTPFVEYGWEYRGTGDPASATQPIERVTSVTYPRPESGLPTRRVNLLYGNAFSVDDMLSRVTGMEMDDGTSSVPIASFDYAGVGMRVGRTLANDAIWQSYQLGTEVGFSGLDTFGRPRIVATYATDPGPTGDDLLHRAQYAYDAAGNRLSAELTQVDVGGVSQHNVRSSFNSYDALNRLMSTTVGELDQYQTDTNGDGTPDADPAGVTSVVRTDDWSLDLLGNWVGGAAVGATGPPGRDTWGNLDGWGTPWQRLGADDTPDTSGSTHAVDEQNQINLLTVQDDAGTTSSTILHDAAGNIIWDGDYVYQYDAWNRLIQVNYLDPTVTDPATQPLLPGLLIKHYVYDGLGRLVRTQSPFPTPQLSQGENRTERFYHDGTRRIVEYNIDPVQTPGGPGGGGPGGGHLDGSVAGVGNENTQMTTGLQVFDSYLSREYVWGPGDGFAGVDELLVQYDRNEDAVWVIQDAGGDVVAVCDVPGPTTPARVVGQWTYDAYGAPLSADILQPHAEVFAGHKGRFIDRLDKGVSNITGGPGQRRNVPFAQTIVHYGARSYSPGLGRFMQRDPNGTATTLIGASAYHGRGVAALIAAFNVETMYGDGMNLYEYLGSNPWNRFDPLGLSWDPFDMVDDYMAESAGNRAAFLSSIGQDAKALAITTAKIASMLPIPGAGLAGDLALYVLGDSSGAEFAAGIALGIIPGGKLLGPVANVVGKMGASAWKSAGHYASKAGSFLADAAGGLVGRAKKHRRAKPRELCNCFAAGTLVWTLFGQVPIEQVAVGDWVLSIEEESGVASFQLVTATYVINETAPLVLRIVGAAGERDSLVAGDAHPIFVNGKGWTEASELQPGDVFETISGTNVMLEAISFTSSRTTVYDLTVASNHSYLVGQRGVWVHNCNVLPGNPWSMIAHIKAKGSPPRGYKGGGVWKNQENRLPVGVTYKKWDIWPQPSKSDKAVGRKAGYKVDRGLQRLVSGSDGSWWVTYDHYDTFIRLE